LNRFRRIAIEAELETKQDGKNLSEVIAGMMQQAGAVKIQVIIENVEPECKAISADLAKELSKVMSTLPDAEKEGLK
jgi:hypothetical protein